MPPPSEPLAPPDRTFQDYLARGEMRLQQCNECRKFVFFPRTICPHCGSANLDWQPISGAGQVYSTTIVRQRPDRGGDYNLALIDLVEGVRMMSRVEGVTPHEVQIGMRVTGRIAAAGEARTIVFDGEPRT